MASGDIIESTVKEDSLHVSLTEETLLCSMSEDVVQCSFSEEVIVASISPEVIQSTLSPEEINVQVECVICEGGSAPGSAVMHLEKEFDFQSQFPVLIGRAIANAKVESVMLEILEPFNPGVTLTIGTQQARALLMEPADSAAYVAGDYFRASNVSYEGVPDFYVFIETGAPTQGKGKVTIYFS